MPDWDAFVRRHASARRPLADAAIEELAQHVEQTYREALAAGQTEAEALAAARAEVDDQPMSVPRARTAMAGDARGFGYAVAVFWRDLQHGGRLLRLRPGYAAVAILTLALGIGPNTAIFSVIRSALLEPLPFPRADRLVMLFEAYTAGPSALRLVAAPNFLDWQREVHAFEASAIWEYLSFNISGDGEPERVPGMRVSSSVFSLLELAPEAGRTFTADEDQPGHHVAVISDGLWTRRFSRRADAIGAILRLNGEPYQVIGVMPPAFRFTAHDTAIWIPIAFNRQDAQRGSHSFLAAARLRDGVAIDAARAEFEEVGRELAAENPVDNSGETATLFPMKDWNVVQLRPTLFVLTGAVVLVLAIACVNVANLLLAQASARRREFGVRVALGASRRRLACQLMAEGLVLSLLGGVVGLFVATASTRALASLLPPGVTDEPFRLGAATAHLDIVVLGFTAIVSIVTGLLFSLAPLVGIARPSNALASADGRGATVASGRLRRALVAVEVALAVVVLTAAGLMIKSLDRLLHVDPGLDPRNVLALQMTLPQADFYGPPIRKRFCADVTERVGSLAGVVSVGATSQLPLSGGAAGRALTIDGQPYDAAKPPTVSYQLTCPGYFRTLGIAVLRGRDFTDRDATDAPPVAIVSELTAERYWPHQDAIGKRILIGHGGTRWLTIVGIVGNVRHFGLDVAPARELYLPYSQSAWPEMTVAVKTASDPAGFATSIRSALERIDPDVPVARVRTMVDVMERSTGARRSPMMLLGVFGAAALALAVVGVYGVVSYIAAQRMREMGIRVALGANMREVLRLVVGGAMGPVLLGVCAGIVGAAFAGRVLRTLLFEVQPSDPAVITLIALGLIVAAAVAAVIPAKRASRVDPITILKAE